MELVIRDFEKKTLDELDVGLFLSGNTLCVKSEYRTNGRPDCIIVLSGGNYCGDIDGLLQVEIENNNPT